MPILRKKEYVEFDQVSFYVSGGRRLRYLKNISFTAKPGETTAIIGSTGCGKSTLLNLIPRFYDVTEGKCYGRRRGCTGYDSARTAATELGYVPQKGVLFSGTIESNITVWKSERVTQEMIQRRPRSPRRRSLSKPRHDGYDSPILPREEPMCPAGRSSGFPLPEPLPKHPEIYLFDDSFSALDYKTDVALRQRFEEEQPKMPRC